MILVVGGTGLLGGTIVRRLLQRGEEVRVLVRQGSPYHELVEAGAQAAMGDLKDRQSLNRAMVGVRTVITTANSASRDGDDNVESVEIVGNENLIDAARNAGVAQFIFVSALGASADHPVPFMRGKGLTEQYLRESGVPFTILTPNFFMDVWIPMIVGAPIIAGQSVILMGEGRRKHSLVSVDDVASFALASIGNQAAINQQLTIGGPLAVSWREIVAAVEGVMNLEIPIRVVTTGGSIPGLPPAIVELAASLELYDSPIDMTQMAEEFGVRLTSVEEYVERSMA